MDTPERRDLARLGREVECHPMDLLRMGLALKEILERGLWRKNYRSFGDYCEQEHGFQHRYALKLIDAALDDPPPAECAGCRERNRNANRPESGPKLYHGGVG